MESDCGILFVDWGQKSLEAPCFFLKLDTAISCLFILSHHLSETLVIIRIVYNIGLLVTENLSNRTNLYIFHAARNLTKETENPRHWMMSLSMARGLKPGDP